MLKISEIKMKCDKCGKEKVYHEIIIDGTEYNQFVITICDMDEENFEDSCECERDEN
jgi:uncharacterized Zn finger protein